MKRPAPPVLEVTGLGIVRDRIRILDNVTWRVEAGENWAIVGSNGSGKTSLLAALTGYLMPTRGEVAVLGRRFGETDWRELRTRIGWVSSSVRQLMAETEPALFTVASGRYAMIDFWGTPSAADQRAARRWLELVEAGHVAQRPWAVLSQGERQRVLIARALMARPKLLILDEPCAGLDPVAREHFLQFLNRLTRQQEATALVLVTHHIEEITPVFTHALLLREGRVVGAGSCETTLTSRMLSQVFASPVRVQRRLGQYRLMVRSRTRRAM